MRGVLAVFGLGALVPEKNFLTTAEVPKPGHPAARWEWGPGSFKYYQSETLFLEIIRTTICFPSLTCSRL